MIMLSSLHYSEDTDQTPPFKPKMIIDYNKSKSGVDSLDQVVKNYSCRRSSSRWPLQIFYWILDVAAYNASVCYMQENPTIFQGSQKRRKFLLQLSEELVLPQIKRRSQSEGYQKLHKDCRIKIQAFVPNPTSVIPANVTGKRKRCSICPSRIGKKLPIHALIAIFQFVMNMPILCVMTVYRFHEILDKPAFNKLHFN